MQRTILAVLLSLLVAAPLMAQLPSDPADVPVYPGATPYDLGMEPEFRTHLMEDYEDPIEVLDQGRRSWEVEAAPEDVYAWYRDRLGIEEWSEDDLWTTIEEGGAMPAFVILSPHDLEREGGGDVFSGAQIRRMMEAGGRRSAASDVHAPPVYLNDVSFGWAVPLGDGEVIEFSLDLSDNTSGYGERPHRTAIDLQWSRYLRGEAADEYAERAEDERDRATYEARRAEMGSAPTEEQMGVPPYAGARYHADLSIGMSSSEDERYYVFLTDDDPSTVKTFYESATGKTARALGGDGFVVAIEGRGIIPEHGVMVGPTAGTPYASDGRTLITVRRVIATDEDEY